MHLLLYINIIWQQKRIKKKREYPYIIYCVIDIGTDFRPSFGHVHCNQFPAAQVPTFSFFNIFEGSGQSFFFLLGGGVFGFLVPKLYYSQFIKKDNFSLYFFIYL